MWITYLAGRLKPGVIFAEPVGSSWPCLVMISLQASRSWTPAAEWMALSMQLWSGTKHPSSSLLAALTIASTFRRVMSPCQRSRPLPSGSTTPFSFSCSCSSASWAARNSSLTGLGGRMLSRALIMAFRSLSPSGISVPKRPGSSSIRAFMMCLRFSSLFVSMVQDFSRLALTSLPPRPSPSPRPVRRARLSAPRRGPRRTGCTGAGRRAWCRNRPC